MAIPHQHRSRRPSGRQNEPAWIIVGHPTILSLRAEVAKYQRASGKEKAEALLHFDSTRPRPIRLDYWHGTAAAGCVVENVGAGSCQVTDGAGTPVSCAPP